MAADFLLEIGTEEIPARFMDPALQQLREIAAADLSEKRIAYDQIRTYGTPRRLALYISRLADRQEAMTREVKGPALKAAYDDEGQPTKAALGFARSQGIDVKDFVVRQVGKAEYVFAVTEEKGEAVPELLEELCPAWIRALNFPKPMRWGNHEMRFARPIHWLVALYGSEVISFKLEDLLSGRTTRGHRFLGSQSIELSSSDEYVSKLELNYVIADPEKRQSMIEEQIEAIASENRAVVDADADLLREITYLVEYPTAFVGRIDPSFLELPRDVVITPMREHQRYFPLLTKSGELLPKFIAVRNGDSYGLETVTHGNERVLTARLKDAQFFYQEDNKQPLADYVPKLKSVVFQEKLGTVYDKTERISALALYLAVMLQAKSEEMDNVKRAAELCKADLVTNMVYEFTELQGIMGRYYARNSGEKNAVCEAVFEHYLPRFAEDELPQTMEGCLLSIADKIDTIVGCFAIGIQPTGSQDPYALRRQALGISNIIMSNGFDLDLAEVITRAYEIYSSQIRFDLPLADVLISIESFFKQRLKAAFAEKGLRYDEIDAVLALPGFNINDMLLKGQALSQFRSGEDFDKLTQVFTRADHLAQKAEVDTIKPQLLQNEQEQKLFAAYCKTYEQAESFINDKDFCGFLQSCARLQPFVDDFFDNVMVMDKDENIKNNRLALLKNVVELMRKVADLSLLQ